MPNQNVTVTATYKTGTLNGSTSSGSSSGTSSGSTSTDTSGNGTGTVDIDSDDISNKKTAQAVANNSTDNFVLKISQDVLTQAVGEYALREAYGSLDDLEYCVFDISLYDASGKYQITEYDNLSISVTLPIPDDLIEYGGNVKVAAVVDDQLDTKDTRFATIDGVTCTIFDATHFSPYIVYVDTSNLNAGVATDATPKTGDGINPKWFLSGAMVFAAIFLFIKKDKIQGTKKTVQA